MACNPGQLDGAMMAARGYIDAKKPMPANLASQLNECAAAGSQAAQDVLTQAAASPQYTPTPTGTPTGTMTPSTATSTPPPLTQPQTEIAATGSPTAAPGTPSPVATIPASVTPTAAPVGPLPTANPTPTTPPPPGKNWQDVLAFLQGGNGPGATSAPPINVSPTGGLDLGSGLIQEPPPRNYQDPSGGGIPGVGMASGLNPSMRGDLGAAGSDQGDQALASFLLNNPESWLAGAGIGAADLYGMDAANNPDQLMQMLDLYGGQSGQPEWWKTQIAPFAQSVPGLLGLQNPGQPGMQPLDFLNSFSNLDQFETPGSYIDPQAMYDNLFSGQGLPGTKQDINDLQPDEQIKATMDAVTVLQPYLAQDTAAGLQRQMAEAAIDWKNLIMTGQLDKNVDFLTYLSLQGADSWL